MSRPHNILIIMADQLSAKALGCYAHPVVKSPHIDWLAATGVRFDAAYSSSPLCTPARYAFMTGRHVSRCGGYDNAAFMPATMPTFAHYLRLMGFRTLLCGKMHFIGPDQHHGFEERLTTDSYPVDFGWTPDWTRPDERIERWYHNMSSVKQAGVAAITHQLHYDDEVGHRALNAIYDHARSDEERPFCLVASFVHPHDPYATRQRYWDLYQNVDIDLPRCSRPPAEKRDPHQLRLEKAIDLDAVDITTEDIYRARRAYYANVSYVDEWVGRLYTALSECGYNENTTILFTADHGDMLGEYGLWYKMSFREWACRIPLIIWQPGQLPPGQVEKAVSLVDILPTLLDIAARNNHVQKPPAIDPLDGRSLLALCENDASDDDPDLAISEYLAEATHAPMLMIRCERYKYIHCLTDPEQLFDLYADPDEQHNLAPLQTAKPLLDRFRHVAAKHWDPDIIRDQVIIDQQRRHLLHAALTTGRYHSWDYQPRPDTSVAYISSRNDLSDFDIRSRFPRPSRFKPKPD